MKALLLLLVATSAQAGYSCVEIGDATGRRWFQEEPCAPGYVHSPLPNIVVIDAPPWPPEVDPRRFTESGPGYRRRGIVIWTFDNTGRRSVSVIRRQR